MMRQSDKREKMKYNLKLLLLVLLMFAMFYFEFKLLVFVLKNMKVEKPFYAAFFLLYFVFPLFKTGCVVYGVNSVK